MKKLIKIIMGYFAFLIIFLFDRCSITRNFIDLVSAEIQSRVMKVWHGNVTLFFYVPNALNRYRASSFSTKEPETLKWIDTFEEGSIFWDIGANIGVFSCYAASRGASVVAFEPSVFNLELLSKNIFINKLENLVKIFPLALNNGEGFQKFYLSNIVHGGALSTFGAPTGHDGKELKSIFEYSIYGISLDFAAFNMGLEPPNYLKIDVDGMEHLILKGGSRLLQRAKSVLVEINDQFTEQSDLTKAILIENNFEMIYKLHSETVENSQEFNTVFNQIWINRNHNQKNKYEI